jgi:hypothetical protein
LLDNLFTRFDLNKDGVLQPDELSDPQAAGLIRRLGLNPENQIRREAAQLALQAMASRGAGAGFGQAVEAGKYRIMLTVDDKEFTADIVVETDPEYPDAPTLLELEEEEFEEMMKKMETAPVD